MKISELIKEFDSVKSESFSRLSPKMKDAIKDMLGLVETDKSKENLLILKHMVVKKKLLKLLKSIEMKNVKFQILEEIKKEVLEQVLLEVQKNKQEVKLK